MSVKVSSQEVLEHLGTSGERGDSPAPFCIEKSTQSLSAGGGRSGVGMGTGGKKGRQDKASCLAAGISFLSLCLHIVFW